MRQHRNVHNLLRDFNDEIPGYLHNSEIREALESLPLQAGVEKIGDNLRVCYEKLVSMFLIAREELELLDVWLEEVKQLH